MEKDGERIERVSIDYTIFIDKSFGFGDDPYYGKSAVSRWARRVL